MKPLGVLFDSFTTKEMRNKFPRRWIFKCLKTHVHARVSQISCRFRGKPYFFFFFFTRDIEIFRVECTYNMLILKGLAILFEGRTNRLRGSISPPQPFKSHVSYVFAYVYIMFDSMFDVCSLFTIGRI